MIWFELNWIDRFFFCFFFFLDVRPVACSVSWAQSILNGQSCFNLWSHLTLQVITFICIGLYSFSSFLTFWWRLSLSLSLPNRLMLLCLFFLESSSMVAGSKSHKTVSKKQSRILHSYYTNSVRLSSDLSLTERELEWPRIMSWSLLHLSRTHSLSFVLVTRCSLSVSTSLIGMTRSYSEPARSSSAHPTISSSSPSNLSPGLNWWRWWCSRSVLENRWSMWFSSGRLQRPW